MQMTVALHSQAFLDEIRKRSEIADGIAFLYGEVALKQIAAAVVEVMKEYKEKHEHNPTAT